MSSDRESPGSSYVGLEAQNYYLEVLRPDPEWMEVHRCKCVAVTGQKVYTAENFEELSLKVRSEDAPIFMTKVGNNYPGVIIFRPRITRP